MAISYWNVCHGHPGRALGHDYEALQPQIWTVKWQMCARLLHGLQQRVAAGRFAVIKASRRFLCSSRGPIDVKTLRQAARQDGWFRNTRAEFEPSVNWITQKVTIFSVWTNNYNLLGLFCFLVFLASIFPQSAKMKWSDPVTSRDTTNTKSTGPTNARWSASDGGQDNDGERGKRCKVRSNLAQEAKGQSYW